MPKTHIIAVTLLASLLAAVSGLEASPSGQSAKSGSSAHDSTGTTMDTFDVVAGKIITAMETHARKLGVKGVIVVASMDDRGFSWESRMKAVEANKVLADNPQKSATIRAIISSGLPTPRQPRWPIPN